MVLWRVKTREKTVEDVEPHKVEGEILSVERYVGGRVFRIPMKPYLASPYMKTDACFSMSMNGKGGGNRVTGRIVGVHLKPKSDRFYRLELHVDPSTGNCQLNVVEVDKVTDDGF